MLQKIEMVNFKNAAKSFFDGYCDIYEYEKYMDDSVTRHRLVCVLKNVRCRRSYSTGTAFNFTKTGEADRDKVSINQPVKLFVSSDINVKPGSYIRFFRDGIYEYYKYSGHCLRYKSHTEVLLKAVEKWA